MRILLYISNLAIPLVVFYFVGIGILNKQHVYEDFVRGATSGLPTVCKVMPTLIGLMIGVGVLSSSGFMEFLTEKLGQTLGQLGLPAPVIPEVIVRLFSSSAATGIVLDIFKEYGTDSHIGILASLIMCSTETCFYTMSVYFMSANVTKGRWTLAGALLSGTAGVIASICLAGWMV